MEKIAVNGGDSLIMGKVIGIDLGTTFSVMAYIDKGRPVVIPNEEGKLLTPSVVGMDKEGRLYVGEMAKARALFDSTRTVFAIKRQMGKDVHVSLNDHSFTPQEISAQVLLKLKRDAERYFNESVDGAVITVPAYFNETSRQATKEAGQIAGFDVLRILNEPTAATLAYGLGRKNGELVMVLDLGGGTFDVTALEFANGVYEVKATSGDTWLGGDDWTAQIASYIKEKGENELKFAISTRPEIRQRILIAAEAAKIDLTTKPEAIISLPCLEDDKNRMCSFHTILKRPDFYEMTRTLTERMLIPIQAVLKDSALSFNDISKIILVGGATRMPQVRESIKNLSGKEPYIDVDPDIVVGLGAAVQAGILTGEVKDTILVDVIPLSLGIETRGGIFTRLIPRNSSIPTSYSQVFTTARDNQTEVEIHVLQGERELAGHNVSLGEFRLADIPPLSKGMAKVEVFFAVDADGILNVSASDVYTGTEQSMTINLNHLDRGEISKLADDAGRFKLSDQKEKDHILARLEADDVINATVETIPLLEEKGIPSGRISEAVAESRKLLESGEIEELKISISHLKKLVDEAHAKL